MNRFAPQKGSMNDKFDYKIKKWRENKSRGSINEEIKKIAEMNKMEKIAIEIKKWEIEEMNEMEEEEFDKEYFNKYDFSKYNEEYFKNRNKNKEEEESKYYEEEVYFSF